MSVRGQLARNRARLRGHIAAANTARIVSAALWGAALFALYWRGVPHAIAFALAAGVFYLARPGPDETLDRTTGRE